MSDPSINSSSKFHHLSCKTEQYHGTNETLNFIYSIWEDDCIERNDNKKWKCLWCDITFQGINDTNALDCVFGKIGLYIKIYFAAIYNAHLSR